MATTLATSISYTTGAWTGSDAYTVLGAEAASAGAAGETTADCRSRQLAAVVTTVLVAVALGALVLTEYWLLWRVLVVPWLSTMP